MSRQGRVPSSPTHISAPADCTAEQRSEFAGLVQRGFPTARDLDRRIGEAALLALHRGPDQRVVAVAALKLPSEAYRRQLFERAATSLSSESHALELGWVLVEPELRGHKLASRLCAQLVDCVPESEVFATTRPSNVAMIATLRRLGFSRSGAPFPHPQRGEELVLFTRGPAARTQEQSRL